MFSVKYLLWSFIFGVILIESIQAAYFSRNFDCGPYGFTCESNTKLRLCEDNNLFGPTFVCPAGTVCNEDSSEVCESARNYIDPSIGKKLRCHRNERLADPSVPGCKGYILCIPNKNRFQGIKFTCSGNTVFNGVSRTCSSPDRYKCPLRNATNTFNESNRRSDNRDDEIDNSAHTQRTIDCKHYKFSVTQDGKPARATFFCPSKPVPGERTTRCTVFSNQFCITLERDDEDQFALNTGFAYRRPRGQI